jgi:hypothetical protein
MIRFVKPKYSGVSKLNNITVLNCNYGYSGFFRGTPVYRMQEQRVFYMKPDEDELVVTVDPVIEKMEHTCIEVNISRNENEFPVCEEGGHKEEYSDYYLPALILSREEALILGLAHELRHLWQANNIYNKRGMAWGANPKGSSDTDADAYAIRKMREWRKIHTPTELYPANCDILFS